LANWKDLLAKVGIVSRPKDVAAQSVKSYPHLSQAEKDLLRSTGVVFNEFQQLLYKNTMVNQERRSIYAEIDRALLYPLVGSAMELYSEVATSYNRVNNATVWVTSKEKIYQSVLMKFLDRIGIEEKIFDWTWSTGAYGDLFVEIEGESGLGITNVIDEDHPLNMSRVDYNGRLIGFYDSPISNQAMSNEKKILPPWQLIHFRLLGVKKRRSQFGDQMFTEYRNISLMVPDSRRVTSKYGTSLLLNALTVYKRLRLVEDSIMLARLSKGVKRNVFKVMVDGTNVEAVSEIIDEYKTLLTKSRAINPKAGSEYYQEQFSPLGVNEDVMIPVWGDVNNLAVETIGGDTDIRFIADLEELRNQLSSALRVPLQLLGGFQGELAGGMGKSALERLDIRFARSARRLQRAVIDGIKRMCMIHLAYLKLDPDPSLFEVHMPETSSAEEEELKDALNTGVDIVDKLSDLVVKLLGDGTNKVELLNYLNQKVLKLDDFDAGKFMGVVSSKLESLNLSEQQKEEVKSELRDSLSEGLDRGGSKQFRNSDLMTFLPMESGYAPGWRQVYSQEAWNKLYSGVKVKEELKGVRV